MELFSQLSSFDYSHSHDESEALEELTERFKEVARKLMYGGYIDVWNTYRIYIRDVEFYFHEEVGFHKEDKRIKDEIVYHRDEKFEDIKSLPYFPTMSLHAHASGYDITFEKEGVRASALIRKYAVFNCRTKELIKRNKPKSAPKSCKEWEDYRSTYLYDFLNGFSLTQENRITWVDKEIGKSRTVSEPTFRINAATKKWRFCATEDISQEVK